jgi:hypothetical protein
MTERDTPETSTLISSSRGKSMHALPQHSDAGHKLSSCPSYIHNHGSRTLELSGVWLQSAVLPELCIRRPCSTRKISLPKFWSVCLSCSAINPPAALRQSACLSKLDKRNPLVCPRESICYMCAYCGKCNQDLRVARDARLPFNAPRSVR